MVVLAIFDVYITDEDEYERYKAMVRKSLKIYDAKFVTITNEGDNNLEVIEGNWKPSHLVILEFKTKEHAKTWYNSSEYAEALEIRKKASKTNFILVETFSHDTLM